MLMLDDVIDDGVLVDYDVLGARSFKLGTEQREEDESGSFHLEFSGSEHHDEEGFHSRRRAAGAADR